MRSDLLVFPTAATRIAAAYSIADIGRDIEQTDDESLYKLISIAPNTFLPLGLPTEQNELRLFPEAPALGNATRVAQILYDGASFRVLQRCKMDRLIVRATAVPSACTLRVAIYQGPNGHSGSNGVAATQAQLKASFTFAAAVLGNFEVAPDAGGTFTLDQGLCYVLFGRSSVGGSATFRTKTTTAMDLDTANVNLATHPTTFSTVISVAAAVPATFDPRTAPTGAATPVTIDVALSARLRKT
jgi:hypothetical protein